jgi:hypothetical protein
MNKLNIILKFLGFVLGVGTQVYLYSLNLGFWSWAFINMLFMLSYFFSNGIKISTTVPLTQKKK